MNILVIGDDPKLRRLIASGVGSAGEIVTASTDADALRQLGGDDFDLAWLDLDGGGCGGMEMLARIAKADPSLPVIVTASGATVHSAVEAMRRGAFDFLPKPLSSDQLRQAIQKAARPSTRKTRPAEPEVSSNFSGPEFDLDSTDPQMKATVEMAFRAAAAPTTILILGESGTGKSVLARAVHDKSAQRDNAFVTVNCPCLTRELLESELFGHKKGSFTGAISDNWGKVAAAEGGTLFLDEVGELPLEIQPKLLRLLQDREYERVGEAKARRANVRVIAATNSDLREAVRVGRFREDLYYRLNVIMLTVPPLRERAGDLIGCAEYFLKSVSSQIGKKFRGFTPGAIEVFQAYHWPGNLRELRNVIERTAILCDKDEIDVADLPDLLQTAKPVMPLVGAQISLQRLEEEHIRHVIARSSSFEHAAKVLGIDPTTLYRKRKKMEQEEQRAQRGSKPEMETTPNS